MPDIVEAIRDVCANPDFDEDLSELKVDLDGYACIRAWRTSEELAWQVMLVDGVVTLGSSERELLRFPAEVRKAAEVAAKLVRGRTPSNLGRLITSI